MSARTLPPPHHDGCRALALHVIALAFADAQGWSPTCGDSVERFYERQDALCFLLADHGEWAQARALWAQAADVDAEALRDRALQVLPPRLVRAWRAGMKPPERQKSGPKGPRNTGVPA